MMNQKNYEYLRDQLLYSGFGESMDALLQKALGDNPPQFVLNFQRADDKEKLKAVLDFSKSKQSDLYFWNGYQLELSGKSGEQKLQQYFPVKGRDRYTLKEAYNLLGGRAVWKELTSKTGERYQAWIQLDFKTLDLQGNRKFQQYHPQYGFDLLAELQRFPLRELQYEDTKHYLMTSLQRGNRPEVTFLLESGQRTVAIQANPKFKSLAIYDGDMRLEFVSDDMGQKSAVQPLQQTKSSKLNENEATDPTHKQAPDSTKRPAKKL